jgi:hypothetical protein
MSGGAKYFVEAIQSNGCDAARSWRKKVHRSGLRNEWLLAEREYQEKTFASRSH